MSGTNEKKSAVTGYIVWEGFSPADQSPIVAILTVNSSNVKTGDMSQLWILPRSVSPSEASNTGADVSVCGLCPMRHYSNGACYVMPWREPSSVFKSYQKGNYKILPENKSFDKGVRLGAYGDPAMIPFDVLKNLVDRFEFHTGYTHQWYAPFYDSRHNELLQLSTDRNTSKKASKLHPEAKQFQVVPNGVASEFPTCPAETDNVKCADCHSCDGSSVSVSITAHGMRKNKIK